MCQVLDMSEFLIFVNFRKYDRVLKRETGCNYGKVLNIPGLRIYQVSARAQNMTRM